MSDIILSVDNVDKQYGEVHAVNNLSFNVERGEIFALLGPNGAGKTTTVRMLNNIIQPDSGKIEYFLNGISPENPITYKLGYLPEERGLYLDLKILNILIYFGTLRGLNKKEARKRALDWLEKMELGDRAKEKLNTLSKGNQQKIQFIASIIHQPEFIIFDEPFSGLDPINQDFFSDLITELRENGATIILSAHQMELVEKLADRILLMNKGLKLMEGKLDELQEKSEAARKISIKYDPEFDTNFLDKINDVYSCEIIQNNELFLNVNPRSDLNSIITALADKTKIKNIHTHHISLHDIFVQAVKEGNSLKSGGAE